MSTFDLKRLGQYSQNMVDFHLVMDLVPTLAHLFFQQKTIPADTVCLSYTQSAILIGLGLQFKKVEDLQSDLGLQVGQILPQFNKLMRKFTKVIRAVYEGDIARQMDKAGGNKAELFEAKEEVRVDMKAELDEEEAEGIVARQDQDRLAFLKKHSKVSKVTKAEID